MHLSTADWITVIHYTGVYLKSHLRRLQCLQNVLALVVMGSRKWTHITCVLKSIHWLPVQERITLKSAILIYKYLDSGLSQYFHEYIHYCTSFVYTRCVVATKKYLVVLTFNPWIHKCKTHFDRSCANDGPRLWKSLPLAVCYAPTLASFRHELNVHLSLYTTSIE